MSELLKPDWDSWKIHTRKERKEVICEALKLLGNNPNNWINSLINRAAPALCRAADRRKAELRKLVNRGKTNRKTGAKK
ncbi:MAG TPA: hypothetical protein VGH19_16060 [Verrucomicrobiae bacterium]